LVGNWIGAFEDAIDVTCRLTKQTGSM